MIYLKIVLYWMASFKTVRCQHKSSERDTCWCTCCLAIWNVDLSRWDSGSANLSIILRTRWFWSCTERSTGFVGVSRQALTTDEMLSFGLGEYALRRKGQLSFVGVFRRGSGSILRKCIVHWFSLQFYAIDLHTAWGWTLFYPPYVTMMLITGILARLCSAPFSRLVRGISLRSYFHSPLLLPIFPRPTSQLLHSPHSNIPMPFHPTPSVPYSLVHTPEKSVFSVDKYHHDDIPPTRADIWRVVR